MFACLPCTILIRDPIAQISATKSEMPAPVNFNSCLRPSSCTLSYPISVSKGCSGFSKFPVLLRYLYVFPISLIKDVVDGCILFAVIENWDILFSLLKSLFVTDVALYLETARQVFLNLIFSWNTVFSGAGLISGWFYSLISFWSFSIIFRVVGEWNLN